MGFTYGGFSGTNNSGNGGGGNGTIDSTKIKVELIPYSTLSDLSIVNVKNALDSLFYVPPSITSFTISPTTLEKGTIVNEVTFNWVLNKNVKSQSMNQGVGELDIAARRHVLSGLNITNNTTYTLTVNDGENTVTRNTSISFLNKRYWGVSNLASLTNDNVLALNNELSTTKAQSKSFNTANQYIYFAFPSTFGAPSFKVNGLDNDAWIKTTLLFTNSKGFSENYDVYRSAFLQNGIGITVDVT